MSHVVSIRFQDDQMKRLRRLARRLGRTPSETGALLVEEHISPTVAVQLRAKRAGIEVLSLKEWGYLGESDEVILTNAYDQGLTLVTYDLRTIPSLLKSWGEKGKAHGGVIFIDWQTIVPDDFGGLVRALCQVWDREVETSWRDRVVYFRGG